MGITLEDAQGAVDDVEAEILERHADARMP